MSKLVSRNEDDIANWADITSSDVEFFKNGEQEDGLVINLLFDTICFFKAPVIGKYRLKYLPDGVYTGYGWSIDTEGVLSTTIRNITGHYNVYNLNV
jgi:hypothetical protein